MSIIKSVKDFFVKRKNKSINTTDLFSNADMTADALNTIMGALHSDVFREELVKAFTSTDRPNGPHTFLSGAAYAEMIKAVPSVWKQHEIKDPLICLEAVVGTLIHDLRDIMSNYKAFFADETLKDDDIRISNLVISGYVEAATIFTNWIQWLFLLQESYNRNGLKLTDLAPAKYIIRSVSSATPTVMKLAGEILSRRQGTTFMTILTALKDSHNDVSVSQDGVDITVYAEDSSYSRVELQYTELGLANPFIVIGQHIALRKKTIYEKNRALREWIALRVTQLEQQRNGLDPESHEYKQISKVLSRYLDQISHLDAKIKSYEVQY